MLALYHLALGEYGIGLAQVYADVFANVALHHAGHHVPGLAVILLADHAALLLADFLQNDVFRI